MTEAIRDIIWAATLAAADKLKDLNGPGNRFIPEYAEDNRSASTIYSVRQDDGSSIVYRINVNITEEIDDHGDTYGPNGRLVRELAAQDRVIVNGGHYCISHSRPGTPNQFLGFGGRLWRIKFHDGRYIETNDLMYQGQIPPAWRELNQDNAIFVNENGDKV